jgi:putative addiction module killer protein
MHRIEHYETPDGSDPIQEWLGKLRDKRARATVLRRLDRLATGNFGDHVSCRDGVWELRIDLGPGYRVYYALGKRRIIFLLCGGDKRKQQVDIERAVSYWQDIQRGEHH